MPINTPLTGTPKPTLPDPANVETTIAPGFDNLEKFAIPRFASVSSRNVAFATVPPVLWQMCVVTSSGSRGLFVWTGSAWEEFGFYTGLRVLGNVATEDQTTSNSQFIQYTKCDVTLKAGRKYKYHGLVAHGNSDSASIMSIGWTATSGLQSSIAVLSGQPGSNSFTPLLYRDYDPLNVTPDEVDIGGGHNGTPFPAWIGGHCIVGSSDTTFQLRFRKRSGSGSVTLNSGTWLEFKEYQ